VEDVAAVDDALAEGMLDAAGAEMMTVRVEVGDTNFSNSERL
jgi:hypothetical protein